MRAGQYPRNHVTRQGVTNTLFKGVITNENKLPTFCSNKKETKRLGAGAYG